MDALTEEDVTKVVCVFRISVENQIPLAAKDAVLGIGDIARNLRHPSIVGVGCDAGILLPHLQFKVSKGLQCRPTAFRQITSSFLSQSVKSEIPLSWQSGPLNNQLRWAF